MPVAGSVSSARTWTWKVPTTCIEPPPASPPSAPDLPAPLFEPAVTLVAPPAALAPLLPPPLAEPPSPDGVTVPEHAARAPTKATQNVGPAKLRNSFGIVIASWVFKLSGPSIGQSDQPAAKKIRPPGADRCGARARWRRGSARQKTPQETLPRARGHDYPPGCDQRIAHTSPREPAVCVD